MRIVFNTAFCGVVAGPLYPKNCPVQAKKYPWCDQYVAANPEGAFDQAYWELRGVYVYQNNVTVP